MAPKDPEQATSRRIVKLELEIDPTQRISSAQEHERAVAVFDLLDDNHFHLVKFDGPYHLYLRSDQRHIHFDIRSVEEDVLVNFFMALGPMRRIIRDYFQVCDSYYEAIRTKSPSQIQAIDMGRRALHDEGSDILQERLSNHAVIDHDTARRLFTLICVLITKPKSP
ncbi:MAG: UPF0262 family protein [Candidatus Puniceispirillaceae bacterium]